MNAQAAKNGHGLETSPFEDLTFRPSPANSVGVEIELQIVDRETGDLAPGSVRILHACEEEGIEGVTAELMQSMIEIKTGVCRDVSEARDQLVPLLRRVANISGSLGYDLAPGGTHPFSRGSTSALFPADRYQRVKDRMAGLTYQLVTYGLHVHVGMPGGDVAMGAINTLVQYLPHLLATSANSPFWQGTDTGLASCRAALFQLAPHSGMPHYFANWKDFSTYCQVMHGCGAIAATKDIHWDIRPRPQTGTIEYRICDVPPTLSTILGLTALMRCLAVAAQRLMEDRPRLRRGDPRRYWVAVENKWLAGRYGLRARCIRSPGRKSQVLSDDLARLLERLRPVAEELGEDRHLAYLQPVVELESGADRQRRLYRESGQWEPVIADMKERWAQDLETIEAAMNRAPVTTGAS